MTIEIESEISTHGRTVYSIEAEDLMVDRLFYALIEPDQMFKGFFIDIGAFDPIRASNTFLLYRKGWTGVNVDPNQLAIQRFQELRPKDIAVHAAIGPDGTSGEYLMFDEPLLNGFVPSQIGSLHIANGNHVISRSEVPFRSVTSLLSEFAPGPTKIDLLNLDVATMEFSILSRWDFSASRPRIIAIEIHGPLAVTELAEDESAALLGERGYSTPAFLWTVVASFLAGCGEVNINQNSMIAHGFSRPDHPVGSYLDKFSNVT